MPGSSGGKKSSQTKHLLLGRHGGYALQRVAAVMSTSAILCGCSRPHEKRASGAGFRTTRTRNGQMRAMSARLWLPSD